MLEQKRDGERKVVNKKELKETYRVLIWTNVHIAGLLHVWVICQYGQNDISIGV
jgi:hypothetical protein